VILWPFLAKKYTIMQVKKIPSDSNDMVKRVNKIKTIHRSNHFSFLVENVCTSHTTM
jgi:hypothetical protein